jgi:predicted permease
MRSTIYATLHIDGRPPFEQGTGGMVAWRSVTPSYFDTLHIAMKQGRRFNDSDRLPDQDSMILNQTLAARMFPHSNAVGQRIHFGPPTDGRPWFTVVGVADDAKNSGIEDRAEPEFYVVRQHLDIESARRASIVIRTHADARAIDAWMRRAVAELDPTLPVDIESMGDRVGKLMAVPRFDALLLGIFAAMALLLAAIGLYGVVAFLVAQRTQEIGVRMALGATPGGIAKLVLGRAARWTFAGAAIGLAASLAGARVMQSLLYHVQPRDPLALGVSLIVLIAVAMLAAFVPARRAAAVDPMVALRHE